MKKLIIIGAGGFGREVYAWARDCKEHLSEWYVHGFIDDNPAALDRYAYPVPILGSVDGWIPSDDELFVCAIGTPMIKRRCTHLLKSKGAQFGKIIHPLVSIGSNVQVGEGSILCPGVRIGSDVKIAPHVSIDNNSVLGHDCQLNGWTHISSLCSVTGFVHIGFLSLVGSGARILPGLSIGSNCTVGSGSVVTHSLPDGVTAYGVPARITAQVELPEGLR